MDTEVELKELKNYLAYDPQALDLRMATVGLEVSKGDIQAASLDAQYMNKYKGFKFVLKQEATQ